MIKQINVFSVKKLIDKNDITVIDVREDHEIEICSEKQFLFLPHTLYFTFSTKQQIL